MSNYCTANDILNRVDLYELFQRVSGSLTVLTEAALSDKIQGNDMTGYSAGIQAEATTALARIDVRITDATGVINSYLGGKYTLPMLLEFQPLISYCVDISVYYLYQSVLSEGDMVFVRYTQAMAWLKDVSSGKISLGLDTTDTTVTSSSGGITYPGLA